MGHGRALSSLLQFQQPVCTGLVSLFRRLLGGIKTHHLGGDFDHGKTMRPAGVNSNQVSKMTLTSVQRLSFGVFKGTSRKTLCRAP